MLNKLEARLAAVETKPKRQGNDKCHHRCQQRDLTTARCHCFFIATDQEQHERCTNQRKRDQDT